MEDTTIADVLKTFGDFYEKKDFKSALQTLKDHPESMSVGQWHYNLGLVHARMGNWAESRFHFLAAEKTGMMNSDIDQNINLVTDKLEITKLEKPQSFTDYFFKTTKFLSGGELTTISLFILMIGLFSLKKKMTAAKLAFVIIFSLLPLSIGWVANKFPEAVVINETKIQEGPSKIFGAITDVPAGIKVIIQGEGEWRQVIYPSRFRGWIQHNVLKELE